MKAYEITDDYGFSVIVFAETREKARTIALRSEAFEDYRYIDIRPHRQPIADSMYDGRDYLEWGNMRDRCFLCDHGWACVEINVEDCLENECKYHCARFVDELSDYYRDTMELLDE